MKKAISLALTLAMILGCCTVAVSAATQKVYRHIIADWDSEEYSTPIPEGASVDVPYSGYKFGKAMIPGNTKLTLSSKEDAVGDTTLAMRVKIPTDVPDGTEPWVNMLFYGKNMGSPVGIKTGSMITYIPDVNNQADISSYEKISDSVYQKATENYNVRLDFGYEGWILIPISDINIDWWNGKGEIDVIRAENIATLHLNGGVQAGTVIDEIQTINGSVEKFRDVYAFDGKEPVMYRNLIADFDNADLTPAGVTPAVPYDGYEFGNAITYTSGDLVLNAVPESAGDNMFALRVKSGASSETFGADWVNLALWASDRNYTPIALNPGSKVYYIPEKANTCSMASFTKVTDKIYSFATNASSEFRFEYGYDGWLVFNLSDFNLRWWDVRETIAPVEADKICKIQLIGSFSAGTIVDEIQTFYGTARDFAECCNTKAQKKPIVKTMLADFDNLGTNPAQSEGTVIEAPYSKSTLGKALKTNGAKTIAISPKAEATNQNLLAFWIKDPNVANGTAHWMQMFLYSTVDNRPHATIPHAKVYYIPAANNTTDMSIYTKESAKVYSKNTENYEFRVDYGYEGYIVVDLNNYVLDWWGSLTTVDAIMPETLSALDFVSDISNGTYIDEIQTFEGSVKDFAQNCFEKESEKPVERTMVTDFDYFNSNPVQPEGTLIEPAFDGYTFGNAFKSGTKNTITLSPKADSENENMLAFWVKDPNEAVGTAHWTKFLMYSNEVNRPQAINPKSIVYYIPTANNKADMSIYTLEATGVYSKSAENTDVRIDYGYEGYIIVDLNDFIIDWWKYCDTFDYATSLADPIAPETLSVMDIVADISQGTYIDEIQTFKGYVKKFAEVCNTKMNVVVDNTENIGNNGIGDFNSDSYVNLLDLVSLKKKIANAATYVSSNDIYTDGVYDTKDLIALRKYILK